MKVFKAHHVLQQVTMILMALSFSSALPRQSVPRSQSGYTAAVVEFHPWGSASDAPSVILATNLERYEQFVLQAAEQRADVVVFPEYGLSGTAPSDDRALARQFSQEVPAEGACPCDLPEGPLLQVARRLSCSARSAGLYLAANLLERRAGAEGGDGLEIFNSDVVFDRSGVVVAKYRKFNLFAESALNQTVVADVATFTTDWGATFGLLTCFDLMFSQPADTLVRGLNVSDVIFPTAWGQELPFLTAVQAQSSWSVGMDVNLLAAGYNHPEKGSTGSGIYGGSTLGPLITFMAQEVESRLLVAAIPASGSPRGTKSNQNPRENESQENPRGNKNTGSRSLYISGDNLMGYNSILLPSDLNIFFNISVSHGKIHCELSYELLSTGEGFKYQLLVYDGLTTHANGLVINKLQVCALVACSGTTVESCADGFATSDYSLGSTFGKLRLRGRGLKGAGQLPNTLLAGSMDPMDPGDFLFQKVRTEGELHDVTLETRAEVTALHTFGIYSHDYEPLDGNASNVNKAVPGVWIVLVILIKCCN